MNETIQNALKGVDRTTLIKGLAGYLLVYAVINVCGGILLSIVGALSGVASAVTAASGVAGTSAEAAQATGQLAGLSGLVLVLGCLSILSVPLFAVAAYGLFNFKKWSRTAAAVALGASILLSVLSLSNGVGSILWIIGSGLVLYVLWYDPEIQTLLVN